MESKEFQKQNNICTKHKLFAKKSTSGITLIALVVTIIVLLILAGISINLILGENGIITKATMAKEAQEMAQLKEEAELVKATGLAENLSKVDGEYGKADLLEDLKNNFEGSILGSDRITTSDGKYDIIVDDNLNITVEKSGETENTESGDIIITSKVVKEDSDTCVRLYFKIKGKKTLNEYVVEYVNTNIYPEITDSTELEAIIANKHDLTVSDKDRAELQKEADDKGVTYSEILKYYIFMFQIQEEVYNNENASEATFNVLMGSKLLYGYYCDYLGEEEYTVAEDIEQQALRIFNMEGTFEEAIDTMGYSKAQLERRAEYMGVTYEQFLRYMIAILYNDENDINVTVSNGQTTTVTLADEFCPIIINEPGEYIITAEMSDGKKGETTVVVQGSEVLDPDGWEVAWTCTDGTTWSEEIINDGTTELPSEGVIAKLYNTGNTITPQLPETLGGVTLDPGTEYKLVFEGSGNMGSLDVDAGYKAWHKTQKYLYISEVIISEGITNIAEEAFFEFISLKTIKIAETVENIENGAFTGCFKLTSSIKIPEEMTSIAEHTFSSCYSITEIILHDGISSIGNDAFNSCESLTNISIPENVTSIGRNAFNGSGITEITIPNGVTEILYGTFSNCEDLRSVTIPSGVTTIEDNAFSYCTKLTSIVIPDTVESIGEEVFQECSALEQVTLSTKINSISIGLFTNCTKLKTITIPNNVISIGARAFKGCTALETIILPEKVKEIYNEAFYNCTSLTSVTILSSNLTLYSSLEFIGLPANSYIYVPNSTIQAQFKDGTHYDSSKTTISIK